MSKAIHKNMRRCEKCGTPFWEKLCYTCQIEQLQSKLEALEAELKIEVRSHCDTVKRLGKLQAELISKQELHQDLKAALAETVALKAELDEYSAENDKVMNEVYMRRKEATESRANNKALQSQLDKANELLRYVYKLPMNEAGSYEENIAWKEAVEQALESEGKK